MKKIYLNNFNNKGVVIDEATRTYTLIKASDAEHIRGYKYSVHFRRLIEVFKSVKDRGFKKA